MKRAAGAIIGLFVILFLMKGINAEIRINEVMYHPDSVSQCSDDYCEYIELFNNGTEPVDLTGWKICGNSLLQGYIDNSDKITKLANGLILLPNGYALITDGGTGTSVYSKFSVDEVNPIALHVSSSAICGELSNLGDSILLYDSLNNLNFAYTSSMGANGDNADGNGHSLQFCNGIWIGNPPTPGSENDCTIPPPNITIIYPINNTIYNNSHLNINYTIQNSTSLSSCWYSNDTMEKNTTITNCFANITSIVWSEGQHNITIWVEDIAGNINKSSVRFTIDTINPNINITSPTNNTNSSDTNLDINYIYSDANIQSCWYSNDSMQKNISINCGQNITIIVWSEGWHNIIIWANDSAGNENKSLVSFIIDSTFPNSSSSSEELSLSMNWEDSEIINGNEFNITLEVNNLGDYSYDIKVWMEFEDDDAVISDRYDENESKWKSGTYYINNFFEGPGDDTKEIPLRIRDNYRNFSGNAKIFFKLRKNGGSTYTDIDESIEILAGENNTGNPEGEILLANTESNNSNQLTAANQNSDGVIQLGNPSVKLGTKNATVQENVIYQSKSEKMKEYSIFGFAALCVFISVLAIFNKL